MRKKIVLSDCFITSAMIAKKWNEHGLDGRKWTGERITRKFREIVDALAENEADNLRSIFKTLSENDENVNKWIFYDSGVESAFNAAIKKIEGMEECSEEECSEEECSEEECSEEECSEEECSMEECSEEKCSMKEGSLSKYSKLIKQAKARNPEYELYQKNVYDTMKRLFELWKKSKNGLFTSSEKDEFINLFSSLIPWGSDLDSVAKLTERYETDNLKDLSEKKWRELVKDYLKDLSEEKLGDLDKTDNLKDLSEEKLRESVKDYLKDLLEIGYRYEKNRADIGKAIYHYFLNTRNADFYVYRVWVENNYSGQFRLMRLWEQKWSYVMNAVIGIREQENDRIKKEELQNKENREKKGELQNKEKFEIKDLTICSLVWYYGSLRNREEYEKERGEENLKGEDYKIKCIDCVNHVTEFKKKMGGLSKDFNYILEEAFRDLEKIGEIDYSTGIGIADACVELINPRKNRRRLIDISSSEETEED